MHIMHMISFNIDKLQTLMAMKKLLKQMNNHL